MEGFSCPHSSVSPPPQTAGAGDRTMLSLYSSAFPRSLSCSGRKMAAMRIISFQWPGDMEGESWDFNTFIASLPSGAAENILKEWGL